jgi:Zn-dependent protease with chaperone function
MPFGARDSTPRPFSAALRDRLDELRDLATFEFDRVMCLRASFGDGKPCFVLLGGSHSTLVISERIVGVLTNEQLLAVLAHEAAHVVLKHGNRKLAWGALGAAACIGLTLAGQLALSGLIPRSVGVVRTLIVVVPIAMLRGLYDTFVTRRHEAEADAFAVGLVGATALLGALEGLRGPNAIEPPIHNRWTTHGTWQQRSARIREQAGGQRS